MNIEVTTSLPIRLDRYLRRLYPYLTQGIIEKMLRYGEIKVNDKKTLAGTRVLNNDIIYCSEPLEQFIENKQQKIFSSSTCILGDKLLTKYLIYQDNNFIAINKPPNLATQGGSKITLSVDDAISYLNAKHEYDMKLVHRLDKGTSGLLLIAKNHLSAYKLTTAFKEKQIKKIYYAVVCGVPKQACGVIEGFLYKEGYKMHHTTQNIEGAKEAITAYSVVMTNGDYSLIEFKPLTGRTHQIRVHATTLGCPIIGDDIYNNSYKKKDIITLSDYMLLNSTEILIPEYVFGKSTAIKITLPDYFNLFIK